MNLFFFFLISISQTPERDFILRLSALEIYNETVIDLLNRESGHLRLLDDPEVWFIDITSSTESYQRTPYISLIYIFFIGHRKGLLWKS